MTDECRECGMCANRNVINDKDYYCFIHNKYVDSEDTCDNWVDILSVGVGKKAIDMLVEEYKKEQAQKSQPPKNLLNFAKSNNKVHHNNKLMEECKMSEYSVNNCSKCGRRLTVKEDNTFHPPTCMLCAKEQASTIKKEMTKNIVISVVLMIVGIVIIKNPIGFMLAGIPYGWAVLNKITPNLFIWMPLVGWVIYFLIKLAISYFIGLVALPIKLFQWISEINKVKKFEEHID